MTENLEPRIDYLALVNQEIDKENMAIGQANQADKALIGELSTENWNAVVTPLGIARQILRHHAERFLVVVEDMYCRALLRHTGGTWIDDETIFRSILDNLDREYLDAMDRIVSRLDPQDGKAERAIYRERIRLWRSASILYAKPSRKVELELRFADALVDVDHQPVQCAEGDLSANLIWIGAPNGVVNLRTGQHIEDADEASKYLVVGMLPDPFDWNAQSDIADQLFSHLTDEIRHYLLSSVAWALRGNPARVFLLLLGSSGGGKTTLSHALQESFGLYASTVSEDAFTRRRNNASGLSPSVRNLIAPRRLAFLPEANKALYDAERLKSISGADRVTWRPLYGKERTDSVTATLVMSANHLPNLDGTDEALMARMRVLPYDSIPEGKRDVGMVIAFKGNSQEAIRARQALVTMVIRAGMGMNDKPAIPTSVKRATDDAMSELIGEAGIWVQENVIRMPGNNLSTKGLWLAVCAALNGNEGDKVVGGLSRQGVVKLVSGKYGKTQKIRCRRLGGKLARGWKGVDLK